MKRILQLLLAGVFLLSFAAQARVILPKGGEEWSVGSTVQLEWDVSGESVTIRLIRPDQEPVVIAEDIADTGHYLWPIEELEAARTYRIEITPSGGDAVQSRTFRIMAWDAKRDLGDFDENDRSRVTHPLEAAVLDKENPEITVDWVDYRHFLRNQVRIYLYRIGKVHQLDLKTKLDNTGSYDWQLDDRSIKACSAGPCYFVIRSARKVNHLITSHSFTLSNVGQGGQYLVVAMITEPGKLGVSWQDNTGEPGTLRIDLYRDGQYYQSIGEYDSNEGDENDVSWPIPATLSGGEDYTVVLTSLADGTKQATSAAFSIEVAEGSVEVETGRKISTRKKTTRLKWSNTQGPVNIDLYRDGRRVKTIARNTPPTRVHSLRLPGVLAASDQYTVRVSQADDEGVFGISAPFSITAPEKVGAKQPSQKLCQAAGLEAGCTRSAIKVTKKARKRECVKYRLYGEACTKKNLSAAKNQREARLASVEKMPTACGKNQEEINGVCWRVDCNPGEIRIGNQCRPESQCPGLALLDESRPENMPLYDGPKRCDQNLIQGESSGDANMAALLQYLLGEMESRGDARVNSQIAVQLFDRYHNSGDGEKSCESTQAQRFFSNSMCSEVAVSDRDRRMTCIRRGDEDSICPSWGNHNEPLVRARARFYTEVMHGPRGVLAQLLGTESQFFDELSRGMKDFKLAFYETELEEDRDLSEDACPQYTGVCRTKGFYWPSEPVVAPEAFDALTPVARVHAEFIWRTAKVREALFDTGRFVNADQELIPNAAHKFKHASSLDPGLYGQDYTLKVPGGGYFGTDITLKGAPKLDYLTLLMSYGNGLDFWGWMGTNQKARDGFYLHSDEARGVLPEHWSTVVSGLTCAPGMGVVEGICTVCEQGTSRSVGAGSCVPCGINQFSSVGASSCALCPMNQVPQKGHGACMDNPCTEKEYWDITTRSCQKDARKRHKWVQMHFVDSASELFSAQRSQMRQASRKLEKHASSGRSPENDREIVWETGIYSLKGGSDFSTGERSGFLPDTLKEGELVERFGREPEYFEGATRLIHTSIKPQDRSVEWSEPAYTNLRSDQASGVRELLRRSARHHEEAQAASGQREKAVFALHFNGHGNGFDVAGTPMNDLRTIIREELGDNRLDLVSFDSCLMANYESLAMMEGVTNWVVGHTVKTPVEGWISGAALNLAVTTEGDLKSRSTRAHVGRVIDSWLNQHEGDYPLIAYDMRKFTPFRQAFDDLLNHLADNIDRYGSTLIGHFKLKENRMREACGQNIPYEIASDPHQYDINQFLDAFEYDLDPAIKELAQTAQRELSNLVGTEALKREWYPYTSLVGGMHSALPFAWRPPLHGSLSHRTSYNSEEVVWWANYPLDHLGNPVSGWEPLKALMRFDRAWQNYLKEAVFNIGCTSIILNKTS